MALSHDIRTLRDSVLVDLNAAHDYYTDTTVAWHIVVQSVQTGSRFSMQYPATGTLTTQTDLVRKARGYVSEQISEATFQQFLSIFENFFFDLLRLWLTAFPQNLGGKQVSFKDVLEAPDRDAITLLVVGKELNEILYRRPAEWFAYLEDRAKLGCPTAEEIDRIAEAKATRDVLTHNRGVANRAYLLKSGRLARYKDGEKIDIPEPYHRETWELLRKVIADVSNAAIPKAP